LYARPVTSTPRAPAGAPGSTSSSRIGARVLRPPYLKEDYLPPTNPFRFGALAFGEAFTDREPEIAEVERKDRRTSR
jgi:hypothetical protein